MKRHNFWFILKLSNVHNRLVTEDFKAFISQEHIHTLADTFCAIRRKLNLMIDHILIFEILLQDLWMSDAGLAKRSEVISTLGECLPRILGDFECTEVTLSKK